MASACKATCNFVYDFVQGRGWTEMKWRMILHYIPHIPKLFLLLFSALLRCQGLWFRINLLSCIFKVNFPTFAVHLKVVALFNESFEWQAFWEYREGLDFQQWIPLLWCLTETNNWRFQTFETWMHNFIAKDYSATRKPETNTQKRQWEASYMLNLQTGPCLSLC